MATESNLLNPSFRSQLRKIHNWETLSNRILIRMIRAVNRHIDDNKTALPYTVKSELIDEINYFLDLLDSDKRITNRKSKAVARHNLNCIHNMIMGVHDQRLTLFQIMSMQHQQHIAQSKKL